MLKDEFLLKLINNGAVCQKVFRSDNYFGIISENLSLFGVKKWIGGKRVI